MMLIPAADLFNWFLKAGKCEPFQANWKSVSGVC